jgi:mRNA-degrading endonuclease RelE of RelBE toxin-antitoxin system
MTEIIWDPKARDFLRKLDRHIARRIYTTVDTRIAKDINRYLESLEGYDFLKMRVGDYRLFVDYYPDGDRLVVRAVEYHGRAYKRVKKLRR